MPIPNTNNSDGITQGPDGGGQENTTQDQSTWSFVTNTAKEILNAKLYKSFTITIIVGYVLIAFGGHISSWGDWERYLAFILGAYILSAILYFIERKNKD